MCFSHDAAHIIRGEMFQFLLPEKDELKKMFKSCLLSDKPKFFPKFIRGGWLQIEESLTVGMLAELYKKV